MNELQKVFNYNGSPVRTVMVDGEPWFVAKDVCEVLEHSNHKVAVSRLDEDEVSKVYLTDSLGRQQSTTVVSEAGLYSLVLTSNKPEAKQFKRWITHEVLPSIRKTGGYSVQRIPQSFAEALQLAADQAKALEAARPAVEFVERYVENDGLKTLRETAKILEVPERKFIKWLQSKGIIYKHNGVNLPYQRYHKEGHFEVKTGDSDGFAFTQTRFTPKGIEWIHRLLLKDGGLV